MKIPIQNIYYLLCYAWNKLDEKDRVNIDVDDSTELQDLFAKILVNGTRLLLKRGIDRSYIETEQEYSGIKGRLLLGESIRRNLLNRKKAICSFDEFSPDILINQILVSTLHKLFKTTAVDKDLRRQMRGLIYMLPDIKTIPLSSRLFTQVRLNRNNKFYEFLLHVCEIIHENLLPTEESGIYKFNDFTRDERKMNQLFEAFIRNFYRREQNDFSIVRKETIKWKLTPLNRQSENFIPKMETDISLENDKEKIIIDAKYYKETLSSYYDSEKIHSTNLYQLFSYLLNQEDGTEKSIRTKGILLYPTIKKNYNLSYYYKNHQIEIRTVDLDMHWKDISTRLKEIIVLKSTITT